MTRYKNIFLIILLSFILIFPTTAFSQTNQSTIPDWVKNTAFWWSQGDISDSEYKNAMKFLIENGIITVTNQNQNIIDRGDFYVEYYEPNDSSYDEIASWVIENEEWIINLKGVNQIKLPYDVPIIFQSCPDGAFFDPNEKFIGICYEFIKTIMDIQSNYYSTEEEIRYAVQDTLYFIFLHELGHAIVDVHNIPITGKQEDAVDQLATIILLTEQQQGIDALKSAANVWHYWGNTEGLTIDNLAFYDEHSLDLQRFYSILCFVYGSNPESNQDLIRLVPEYASEDWQNSCYWTHMDITESWNFFLDPLWN